MTDQHDELSLSQKAQAATKILEVHFAQKSFYDSMRKSARKVDWVELNDLWLLNGLAYQVVGIRNGDVTLGLVAGSDSVILEDTDLMRDGFLCISKLQESVTFFNNEKGSVNGQ